MASPLPSTIYMRSSDLRELRDERITALTLSSAPVDDTPGCVLHWTYSAVIGAERSVCFNLLPGADARTGVMMVTPEPFARDPTAAAWQTYNSAQPKLTIGGLLDILLEKPGNLTHYRFDENGQGCRFWCRKLLAVLEERGIVGAGSKDAFTAYVEQEHARNPPRFPMPWIEGMFY
jgi:hypothetical protein